MTVLSRTALVWLTLASFTACTSMQVISDIGPSALQTQLGEGDQISVRLVSGETRELTITKLDDHALYGTDRDQTVQIPFDQISSVTVRKFSTGRTLGLSAAVLASIYVTLILTMLTLLEIYY